jgi:erythromycin esterase-like protein
LEAYVNGGVGDPASMLLSQDFSIFRIQELVPLLKWMRAYNARHPEALHVVGIDAQEPEKTLDIVKAFVQANAPAAMVDLDAASKCYSSDARFGSVRVTREQSEDCARALIDASSKMEGSTSQASPGRARALMAIGFLIERRNDERARCDYGGQCDYLEREAYPGAKIVVSAEDMHVATQDATMPDWVTMGGTCGLSSVAATMRRIWCFTRGRSW